MRLNPESIARASSRHPWRTVVVWLVVLVTMGGVSQRLLADVLTQQIEFTNDPESVRASDLIAEAFPDQTGAEDTVFFLAGGAPGAAEDPAFQASVTQLEAEITALGPEVIDGQVFAYLELRAQGRQLLLPDGSGAIPIQLVDGAAADVLDRLATAASAAAPSDATVELLTPMEFAVRAGQTEPPPAGTDIPEAFVVVNVPQEGAS
ncbi:MAG: hypothetical protein ACKO8G_04605, partial [Actinomycetota bacterium]